MKNRIKHNLISWLIYGIICYAILLPTESYVINISISALVGMFFGMLNDIIVQLRKLNGEEFPNLDD